MGNEQPYRNQTAAGAARKRERVPAPRPVFSSADEVRAFQGAVATTERLEGELLTDWLARVAATAHEALVIRSCA